MRTLQKRALARRVAVYGDLGFAVYGDLDFPFTVTWDLPHPLRPQSNPFRQPFNPRHRRPQPRFVDRFGHVRHIRRVDRLTYNQRQLALIQRGNLGQRQRYAAVARQAHLIHQLFVAAILQRQQAQIAVTHQQAVTKLARFVAEGESLRKWHAQRRRGRHCSSARSDRPR